MGQLLTGNFNKESEPHRGWIIGHFMEEDSPFQNDNFEIKWGKHKKGESFGEKKIYPDDQRSSLAILIYGKFLLEFPSVSRRVILKNEGDYVFWRPNIPHKVVAQEDSLILTVRWPSHRELTEEEALEIFKEGEREHREGKTKTFESFIRGEYPQFAS